MAIYSVPDFVQGIAFADGLCVASTSHGLNDSVYFVYRLADVTASGKELDGAPVYFLDKPVAEIHGPAMGEDLDFSEGKFISLTESASLFEKLDRLSSPVRSAAPKFMEDIGQSYGYTLYRTVINGPRNDWPMTIEPIRDRAYVFVNGELRAIYDRNSPPTPEESLRLPLGVGESAKLDILIENMGRINYGPRLLDRKGITGVRFGNQYHFGWDIYPLPMDNLDALSFSPIERTDAPVFLRGELTINDEPCDTFLRLDGFTKGFVTVNGINIGRYYNALGPQRTLYVPAPFLKTGKNEIIIFETDGVTDPTVTFTDTPEL